jgi:hypothetical protein
MQIKIIVSLRLKHITANLSKKKEKMYVEFDVRRFDTKKTQALAKLGGTVLKGL